MTTDAAEIRTYGGWRLSRGIGVGKLDSRQTLAFLILVGAVTLLTAFGGLRVGLVTASVAVVVMALLLWRRDGILLIDYAAAATRYRLARARGETSYRGQVMNRWECAEPRSCQPHRSRCPSVRHPGAPDADYHRARFVGPR